MSLVSSKEEKKGKINHIARIVTYVDIKEKKKKKYPKLVELLTNDFDMPLESIVQIYKVSPRRTTRFSYQS